MTENPLVLVSATASGILGEYNHALKIDSGSEFAIVYGPNGVGKTKFLEVIHFLSGLNGFMLAKLPFDSAKLTYSDDTALSAVRKFGDDDSDTGKESKPEIEFTLQRPGEPPLNYTTVGDDFVESMRNRGMYEQISDELWQDPDDGEIVSTAELRSLYGRRYQGTEKAPIDSEFRELAARVPSFLIETQRLRIEEKPTRFRRPSYGKPRKQASASSRIVEQSEQILALLNKAQTEHSKITQLLDRTFPSRVLIAAQEDNELDAAHIRDRYDKQNDFRSRLGKIASVALSEELALPEGALDPWALALLKLYLDDADQKFEPFNDLLDKIELLELIVNSRLLGKKLLVTDQDGLSVVHSATETQIALDALSSGEQHEVILMMNLLFHVPEGAIVLIDEPEISLHVAWQLAFLPDVRMIAEQVGFRFIVATHSPQIINDEWDRAVRLGPAEVSFS